MIKPKVGDTLVYNSEADKSKFVNRLCSNARRHEDYYNNGFYVGGIDDDGDICNSSIAGEITVATNELKYFKIKEKEMLKPDDIINVEMTALDRVLIASLLARIESDEARFGFDLYQKIRRFDANIALGGIRDWKSESANYKAALAQFKNPKQDKIDELEKTINCAAAELAKLKGE